MGFSRRNKIPRCSAYTISEKTIWFRHQNYTPDRAQKLISSSMSRHLSTRNISSKYIHAFLSNLANRQADRQPRAKTFASSFVGGKKKQAMPGTANVLFLPSDAMQARQYRHAVFVHLSVCPGVCHSNIQRAPSNGRGGGFECSCP